MTLYRVLVAIAFDMTLVAIAALPLETPERVLGGVGIGIAFGELWRAQIPLPLVLRR